MRVCISDDNSAYSHSPGSIYNHPEDVPLQLSLYTGQRFILTKQTHFLYTKKKREKRKSSLSHQIHQFNFPLSKYLYNLQERVTGLNLCIICKL